MEAKSPFEEIFSSGKEKKEEEKEPDLLNLETPTSAETASLTGDRYIDLIVDLVKGKYFYEAIEIIKEMAGEGI